MTRSCWEPRSTTRSQWRSWRPRGSPTSGGVQYFTNGLNTRTQGVDITANLRVPAGANGMLVLNGSLNFTKNEITDVDPLPQVLQDAGSTEPGLLDSVTVIGIEDERPDWRGTLQANYDQGRFSALGRFSYFGGFSSAQPGFCDLCREDYGGKGLVDAEVGYRFNQIKLAIGVRNLFDTYPDHPARRSWWTTTEAPPRTSTTTSGRSPGRRPRRSGTTGGSCTRGRRSSWAGSTTARGRDGGRYANGPYLIPSVARDLLTGLRTLGEEVPRSLSLPRDDVGALRSSCVQPYCGSAALPAPPCPR